MRALSDLGRVLVTALKTREMSNASPTPSATLTPVELLTAGAHSRILLCRRSDAPNAPVVIKATRLGDAPTAARAHKEASLAAMIGDSSAFFACVRGWLVTELEAYLHLEYLPGGDVESLIDREGSLNAATARFYAGCLALGLEALHDQSIVHRDVKPENLCIGHDGYARTVDLAYATVLSGDDGRAHTLLGTPEYLSPEAFTGRGQSYPSDMWAFGISLYVMLLAAHPWDGSGDHDNPQSYYSDVLARAPFFPLNIISKQARALIEACLHKEDEAARPRPRNVWECDFFRYAQPPSAPRGGLDREALSRRELPPPFVPRLSSAYDTRHFRTTEEEEEEEEEEAVAAAPIVVEQPGGQTSVGQALGARSLAQRRQLEQQLALTAEAAELSRYERPPPLEGAPAAVMEVRLLITD